MKMPEEAENQVQPEVPEVNATIAQPTDCATLNVSRLYGSREDIERAANDPGILAALERAAILAEIIMRRYPTASEPQSQVNAKESTKESTKAVAP